MLIAQLSDLHVCARGQLANGVVDTNAMAERALRALAAWTPRPDALLLTGDLVETGRADAYARLLELLAPVSLPLYPVAGNHDEREALAAAFGERFAPHSQRLPGFLQYAARLGSLRLLVLDTVVPRQGHGALCAMRLGWLAERLTEDHSPTLIAMHHPPFATGIAHMDAMGLLEGAPALEALVQRHPQVQAICCGHLHRSIQTRFGGTLAATCPSTAHQIALSLPGGGPDGYVMEPPGFQLHRWHGGRLVSHTVPVGDFGGTQAFA
jgi:Icc protein